MKPWLLVVVFILQCCLLFTTAAAQDSTSVYQKALSFPDRLLNKIHNKNARLEEHLTRQTEKGLQHLACLEQRLKKQLRKSDSLKAKRLFDSSEVSYGHLQSLLRDSSIKAVRLNSYYSGHLDSLQTALRFLRQGNGISGADQAGQVAKQYSDLQNKLNQTTAIQQYLEERKQYLKAQLQGTEFAKSLRGYQEQVYYYKTAMDQYKDAWEQPEKYESQLLDVANKVPSFHDFFSRYSQLAVLFPTPANFGTPQSISGLQTRAGMQALIQQQIAGGGPNAMNVIQQNLSAAQSQLEQIKERVSKIGNGGADLDKSMKNFKPNTLKTKSFLQRLEWGINFQSQKSGYFFPSTTDISLTVGYRTTEKLTMGVGASTKIGWGSNIQHVAVSGQGAGFRSFADFKLPKGGLYASAGFEYNYQPLTIPSLNSSAGSLPSFSNWSRSGLVGISKVISVRSKVFKKTRLQLLWDFLSYQQLPQRQPLLFRVGYNVN